MHRLESTSVLTGRAELRFRHGGGFWVARYYSTTRLFDLKKKKKKPLEITYSSFSETSVDIWKHHIVGFACRKVDLVTKWLDSFPGRGAAMTKAGAVMATPELATLEIDTKESLN